jgi:hypothetical protein
MARQDRKSGCNSGRCRYADGAFSGCGPVRSGNPGSFTIPCATSTRSPATPRSSQNLITPSNSAGTSGWCQFQSGWLVSNKCRYHCPGP